MVREAIYQGFHRATAPHSMSYSGLPMRASSAAAGSPSAAGPMVSSAHGFPALGRTEISTRHHRYASYTNDAHQVCCSRFDAGLISDAAPAACGMTSQRGERTETTGERRGRAVVSRLTLSPWPTTHSSLLPNSVEAAQTQPKPNNSRPNSNAHPDAIAHQVMYISVGVPMPVAPSPLLRTGPRSTFAARFTFQLT